MALIKAINPAKRSLAQGINYITNPDKTEETLISGKDCDAQQVLEEMQTTKELYGKTHGRQYKHFLQSISELMDIKELSNEICERDGLHVMTKEEQTPGKSLSMNEYQVAVKGESWKFKLMGEIDQSRETSQSKEGFIKSMESKGYHVKWTDERKFITYSTPEGHKVRDNKLHDPNYLKEAMEDGYRKIKELKLQPGGTRSADELSLNWTRIENGEITGGTDDHEQPVHRGQSRPDQEARGEREGTAFPNQATQRTRHDHQQETGRAATTELSKAGEGFKDHRRGSENEPRNQQQNNSRGYGSSAPNQDHSQPELEG